MIFVGRIVHRVDAGILICIGLSLTAFSLYQMTGFSPQMGQPTGGAMDYQTWLRRRNMGLHPRGPTTPPQFRQQQYMDEMGGGGDVAPVAPAQLGGSNVGTMNGYAGGGAAVSRAPNKDEYARMKDQHAARYAVRSLFLELLSLNTLQ